MKLLKSAHYCALLFLLLFSKTASLAQEVNIEWTATIGNIHQFSDRTESIVSDEHGDIYVLGMFQDTVDFDPHIGVHNLTASNRSLFIQKINEQGQLIWVKKFEGTGRAWGFDLVADQQGSIYILGEFRGTVDFDIGSGIFNLTSIGTDADIFFAKLDLNGNLSWVKHIIGNDFLTASAIDVDNNGNVYIGGAFQGTADFDPGPGTANMTPAVPSSYESFAAKYDANGHLVWAKSYGGYTSDELNDLTVDNNGNVLATGYFNTTADFDPGVGTYHLTSEGNSDIYILKLDTNGNFVWASSLGTNSDDQGLALVTDAANNVYITGMAKLTLHDIDPGPGMHPVFGHGGEECFLLKLDAAGNFSWGKVIGGPNDDKGISMAIDAFDNIYLSGIFQDSMEVIVGLDTNKLHVFSQGIYDDDGFILKLNTSGDIIWGKSVGAHVAHTDSENNICIDNKANVYLASSFWGPSSFTPLGGHQSTPHGGWDIFLMKLNQDNLVGSCFLDLNQNCQKESHEIGLEGRRLIINPGNIIVQTNRSGLWSADELPAGNYTIVADTTGGWSTTCLTAQPFTVVSPDAYTIVPEMGFVANYPCPAPNISLFAPTLRPGFSNQSVFVRVCNDYNGTDSLQNNYVVVTLHDSLTVQSATVPYTNLGNNSFQVDIGDLKPGECEQFHFRCILSANTTLGSSLCMNAQLFPVDSCALDSIPTATPDSISPCLTPYDWSHLVIRPECNNDTIIFTIINTGDGDMTCFSQVRLFIDGQYIWLDSVQLQSGQSQQFIFPGDGRTWRLEVDQHPFHPGTSLPSATIELCGDGSNWTPDLVNILPQNDADPIIDIFCGVVQGSYDPNDKRGFPLGVGPTHDILPGQDLEYVIRFQNTGTDTAFNIVILDTLSSHFDLLSVQSGVSSDDYSFELLGNGVLKWTFSNIMLPDSNVNEPLSHGFVTFKVAQAPNLPNGTVLLNKAAIYFDFNLPIITNSAHHTIHKKVFTINVDQVASPTSMIRIFPNPTTGILNIDYPSSQSYQIVLYDNLGRILLSKKAEQQQTELDISEINPGIYFVTIYNQEKSIVRKIIKN
ncbi:DUF7619 domain-containing protein [Aureispira anguillae]|uniref:T9SS type A sorting domain-containing protein n=1 Tax=Aureispira anguillae TaxID=2864201 RepID=A0A915YHH9_9BACT|nr:T9SS type A sorting domain-containing protein [Aureispira anguillae]BDS13117.1 T9SS type A sorting domain-containing protein [Aureispira anguillae]